MDLLAPSKVSFAVTPRRAHMAGIAGAGMQALAQVLLARGWRLTGSDLSPEHAPWLADAGVDVARGHAADEIPADAELLIYSEAVPSTSPPRQQARRLGLLSVSYAQVVGELMRGQPGVAVAGAHGKSTTTAMVADILTAGGADPTVLVGATPRDAVSGGRNGAGPLLLAEACEYRENFLCLQPEVALLLGIERDHFDCYSTSYALEQAFERFVAIVPPHGLLLTNQDCSITARILRRLSRSSITFGLNSRADWRTSFVMGRRGRYSFDVCHGRRRLCRVQLRQPGRHQVYNALAAAALTAELGIPADTISEALSSFRGLRRRLEQVGAWQGVSLWDDYAHHPTEVAAALATMRQLYPGRRLWCVFQPHQALRTRLLLDEFTSSLQNADRVAVAEIYRAREGEPAEGDVTAADLAARVRRAGGDVMPEHALNDILDRVQAESAPGDVLITLGAGDIGNWRHEFANRLGSLRAAS